MAGKAIFEIERAEAQWSSKVAGAEESTCWRGGLGAPPFLWFSILLVISLVLGTMSADADEFPSLRDNEGNLKGLLQEREVFMLGPPYPELPNYRFTKIRPAIDGIERLAMLGLADRDADKREFLDLVGRVLNARMSELGVADEIEVLPPFPDPRHIVNSCDTLSATVVLSPYESEVDGKPVVAVVVTLVLWQNETEKRPDESVECLSDLTPPSELDATRVFLVNRNDRDGASSKFRQILMGLIDRNIVRRVIATNSDALDAVESWVK